MLLLIMIIRYVNTEKMVETKLTSVFTSFLIKGETKDPVSLQELWGKLHFYEHSKVPALIPTAVHLGS